MSPINRILFLLYLAGTTVAFTADWGFFAHRRINRLAVFTLPPEMIGFYKKHLEFITEHAVDPDKRRYATRHEAVRHYIDIDHWGRYPFPQVPRRRTDALMRYATLGMVNSHGDTIVILDSTKLELQGERFPAFRMQFWAGERFWADMRLTEVLVPKGRLGRGEPADRRAFLRDRQFVPGLGLSRFEGEQTRLSIPELRKNNWFQGTVEAVYDVHGDLREQARQAAIKDHLASRLQCHPSRIVVEEGSNVAFLRDQPGYRYATRVEMDGPLTFVVRDAR